MASSTLELVPHASFDLRSQLVVDVARLCLLSILLDCDMEQCLPKNVDKPLLLIYPVDSGKPVRSCGQVPQVFAPSSSCRTRRFPRICAVCDEFLVEIRGVAAQDVNAANRWVRHDSR